MKHRIKNTKIPEIKKPNNQQLVRFIKAAFKMLESTESDNPTRQWNELANAIAPFLRIADALGTKIK